MCDLRIPFNCEGYNLRDLLSRMDFQELVENPDKSCFDVCPPKGWETSRNTKRGNEFISFKDKQGHLRILCFFHPEYAVTFLYTAFEIVPLSRSIIDGNVWREVIYSVVRSKVRYGMILYESEKLVVPSGNPIRFNQAVNTCYTAAENWAKKNYPDFECPVNSWNYPCL